MKGIAHITGGGFTDNIPRVFPDGLGAVIHTDAWELPPLFKWIQQVIKLKFERTPISFKITLTVVFV